MNDSYDSIEMLPAKRPTVITVFAILTLIYCGFSLITALLPEDMFSGGDAPSPPREPMLQFADVFLSIVKVAGAILILQMRKLGVYLYVGAELLFAVLMVVNLQKQLAFLDEMAYYDDLPMDPGTFVIFGAGVALIASAAWIGIYLYHFQKMR